MAPTCQSAAIYCLQAVRGNVLEVIMEKDQRGQRAALMRDLDLEQVGGCC